VLVDTSVWIDFLRTDTLGLRKLLLAGDVLVHSCVLGELFVGTLRRRVLMAEFFAQLPKAREVEPPEGLGFIEHHRLWGRGLQWNDVLILAAAKLSGAKLRAHDRRLAATARDMGVCWSA
jgi:predicted nucleic acid-binding protein